LREQEQEQDASSTGFSGFSTSKLRFSSLLSVENIIAEGSEFMPDDISCVSPVPGDPLQLAAIEIHGRVIKEAVYEFIRNVREFQNSPELREKIASVNACLGRSCSKTISDTFIMMRDDSNRFNNETRAKSTNEPEGIEVVREFSNGEVTDAVLLCSNLEEREGDKTPRQSMDLISFLDPSEVSSVLLNDIIGFNLDHINNLNESELSFIESSLNGNFINSSNNPSSNKTDNDEPNVNAFFSNENFSMNRFFSNDDLSSHQMLHVGEGTSSQETDQVSHAGNAPLVGIEHAHLERAPDPNGRSSPEERTAGHTTRDEESRPQTENTRDDVSCVGDAASCRPRSNDVRCMQTENTRDGVSCVGDAAPCKPRPDGVRCVRTENTRDDLSCVGDATPCVRDTNPCERIQHLDIGDCSSDSGGFIPAANDGGVRPPPIVDTCSGCTITSYKRPHIYAARFSDVSYAHESLSVAATLSATSLASLSSFCFAKAAPADISLSMKDLASIHTASFQKVDSDAPKKSSWRRLRVPIFRIDY